MIRLSSRQRAHLRSLAQTLKPIAHIGKEGVTDAAIRGLGQAFQTHELIKVRVLETAPESAKDTGRALAERIDGTVMIQSIGRSVVLYHPDPDTPVIKLPR